MTKIIIGEDCGNSPKNFFLQKLTIAFAKGDAKSILRKVTEDIRWNIVGDRVIQGQANFAEALERMRADKASELTIHHIATHGKSGAVDGTRKPNNGRVHAFCDVYEFKDAKGTCVKAITSYVIEIE